MKNQKISLNIVFVILSTLSSYIFTTILKEFFMRVRPDNIYGLTDYSFPSAHSSLSTAFFVSAFIVISPYIKTKFDRVFLDLICITFPLVIGVSRIVMHVHWVSDVICGWILGFICVAMSYYLVCIFYGEGWNGGKKTHKSNKRK